jgi:hypothetical protein
MATLPVIADGTYNAGTYTLPQQTAIAGEAYDVRAIGTLVQPVAGTNFSYKLFVSYDGGQTWEMPSEAFCAGGPSAKTGQLINVVEDIDTQFSGPALWYVQVSFAKRLQLQGVSVTVTTTP